MKLVEPHNACPWRNANSGCPHRVFHNAPMERVGMKAWRPVGPATAHCGRTPKCDMPDWPPKAPR